MDGWMDRGEYREATAILSPRQCELRGTVTPATAAAVSAEALVGTLVYGHDLFNSFDFVTCGELF